MLKNKKGFTIIESVIAMLLVAIIVGGVFAALMAARRALIEPSYKEDMVYAAETVNNWLKTNVSGIEGMEDGAGNGPCNNNSSPLSAGAHTCNNRLPEACRDGSSLTYTVLNFPVPDDLGPHELILKRVIFNVDCRRDNL